MNSPARETGHEQVNCVTSSLHHFTTHARRGFTRQTIPSMEESGWPDPLLDYPTESSSLPVSPAVAPESSLMTDLKSSWSPFQRTSFTFHRRAPSPERNLLLHREPQLSDNPPHVGSSFGWQTPDLAAIPELFLNGRALSETDDDRRRSNSPTTQALSVDEASFIIQEVSVSDAEIDSNMEVVQPDALEEADSEATADDRIEGKGGILGGIKNLRCNDDDWENLAVHEQRYRRKKKRWSAGLIKRSHSQSRGSDTEGDNSEAVNYAHNVRSARRLRRRVRGPDDGSSIALSEIPHSPDVEVEEQEGEARRDHAFAADVSSSAPQLDSLDEHMMLEDEEFESAPEYPSQTW